MLQASTILTATDGASFFIKCVPGYYFPSLSLLMLRSSHRRMNSMPSSTPRSKRPTSWKPIWTDDLPISPTRSARGPNAPQDQPRLAPPPLAHFQPTSHSGPRIRQNHETCFARSRRSMPLVRLRRSGWRLAARHARCCARRTRRRASAGLRLWLLRHPAPRGGREHRDEGEDDDPYRATPHREVRLFSFGEL